jgi:hypothetical protein
MGRTVHFPDQHGAVVVPPQDVVVAVAVEIAGAGDLPGRRRHVDDLLPDRDSAVVVAATIPRRMSWVGEARSPLRRVGRPLHVRQYRRDRRCIVAGVSLNPSAARFSRGAFAAHPSNRSA